MGFGSKLSCEIQHIQSIHDLSDTLSEGGQADVIIVDFSKAFDKVDHQRLLLKRHRIGINSSVVKWISAFLSNQSQLVGFVFCPVWCSPRLCSWPLSIFYLY